MNDLEKVLKNINDLLNEMKTYELYDAIIQALNELDGRYSVEKLIIIFDTLVDRLMRGEDL